MSTFRSPAKTLGTLDPPRAADLIGLVTDIALVIDREGVVRDVHAAADAFGARDLSGWIGRPWAETVTVECEDKVAELLAESATGATRQRQINHRFADGDEHLVLYALMPLNEAGDRIALGKDLSSLTRLQQRLVDVQQSMERDYARLRQFETRYRMLFRSASEAIVLANATTLRVIEVNPAACELLGGAEKKLVGSGLLRWFEEAHRPTLESAIAAARLDGRPVTLALGEGREPLVATVSVFKTDGQPQLLLRLHETAREGEDAAHSDAPGAGLAALLASAPDAMVVTDTEGRILAANTEFLDLAQLAGREAARGHSLSQWLGDGGIDYQIIMASLREHGSIRLYATRLRGEFGAIADVEVSAVPLPGGEVEGIGFVIRDIGHRVAANEEHGGIAPRSIDQLTQLVGRVPLKELVRESTELIEQLCIQAALRLTNNNRASAAEMLGLSRQSLYVKLRRYALEDEGDPPG